MAYRHLIRLLRKVWGRDWYGKKLFEKTHCNIDVIYVIINTVEVKKANRLFHAMYLLKRSEASRLTACTYVIINTIEVKKPIGFFAPCIY